MRKCLKRFFVIILCVVFFTASCLFNFSLAATYGTGTDNVGEGLYYFENLQNSGYMEDLDGYSCIVGGFSGLERQRWELIYVSEGYYNIRNIYSGYYLTAPGNNVDGALVEQYPLSYTLEERQLWRFETPYGRYDTYTIQAKSHETTYLVLAVSYDMGIYGLDLIQTTYSNDEEVSDEWRLQSVKNAFLLGIDYNETGHDHTTAIRRSAGMLDSSGCIVEDIVTEGVGGEDITKSQLLSYLETSNVIIIRSHGGTDSLGTYMALNEFGNVKLHSWDIYNYNGNRGKDMCNCDVIAFVGCQTANHDSQSLIHSAVLAGARNAIGFTTNIGCSEANTWTQMFTYYYSDGDNAYDAAYNAVRQCGITINEFSCEIEMVGG